MEEGTIYTDDGAISASPGLHRPGLMVPLRVPPPTGRVLSLYGRRTTLVPATTTSFYVTGRTPTTDGFPATWSEHGIFPSGHLAETRQGK